VGTAFCMQTLKAHGNRVLLFALLQLGLGSVSQRPA
jgi:hypothetical protein